MHKQQYPDSLYSMPQVLGKKPIMALIHKGIKKGFLANWYKENPAIHHSLMQLAENGYSLTILPWDGNGELLNHINSKNRRCILIFQDGDIQTDIDLKRLILLSNMQGWLIIQKDKIINKKPSIKKDVTGTHLKLLVQNQLKDYQGNHNPSVMFSK